MHPFLLSRQWHIMPLFAHWRQGLSVNDAGRGVFFQASYTSVITTTRETDTSIVTTITNNTTSKDEFSNFLFCSFDEVMEERLRELHNRQRLHGDVQHLIDQYLIACLSPDLRKMVLPQSSVPHYDNLPDISAYAIGILDPAMDSDPELQQILLLLRQCTPLRRRTKRAQREVQWKEDSLFPMQTLVRCMQGTLLGLYPNCLKATAFAARVELLRFLRTLLVQPFSKLHACMQRIPCIVKLSTMEHLCNTIYDYHPGICHTLNRSGQKMEHFCNSVSTICDIFRCELNTLFSSATSNYESMKTSNTSGRLILNMLPKLEKMAHSYFERCTRAYRGIIVGGVQSIRPVEHARRLLSSVSLIEQQHRHFINNIFPACNQTVFDMVHAHVQSIPHPVLREFAWYLTQTVHVHTLPICITKNQAVALQNRYCGDTTCMNKCRKLHVCIRCIIRKGSMQGTRLRHDCLTRELMCMFCGADTVLEIDMLGRIVVIADDTLLLSSCCGTFIHYAGSGYEFSTQCGVQCAGTRQLFRKRERTQQTKDHLQKPVLTITSKVSSAQSTIAKTTHSSYCVVCNQRNAIQQTIQLLEPCKRAIYSHSLCSKHVLPQHILMQIRDTTALLRFFKQRRQNARSSK